MRAKKNPRTKEKKMEEKKTQTIKEGAKEKKIFLPTEIRNSIWETL